MERERETGVTETRTWRDRSEKRGEYVEREGETQRQENMERQKSDRREEK